MNIALFHIMKPSCHGMPILVVQQISQETVICIRSRRGLKVKVGTLQKGALHELQEAETLSSAPLGSFARMTSSRHKGNLPALRQTGWAH